MKKAMVVLGSWVIALLAVAAAQAADGGDFKATASIKAWYNSWEEKNEGESAQDFGSAWMVGPALTLRYKSVVLGASYLVSVSGYEPDPGDLTYDRKDLDVTLTYMFVPRFGVFVGYKSIDSPISVTDGGEDYGTLKFTGPGVGITANYPIGQSLAVYANVAGLKLDKEYDTSSNSFSFDTFGWSVDAGFAYAFNQHLSATLSFKGQQFKGEDDLVGEDHTSTFLGAAAGLNYTF